MNNSSQVIVVRRPVKHVRLRVREDCSVEAIVPLLFNDAQVQSVLDAKVVWIERAKSYFKNHPAASSDDDNKLFLFGQRFDFIWDPGLRGNLAIDESKKIVRHSRNLNLEDVRAIWYRKVAGDFLRSRTRDLAEAHGFSFNRVYVRNQRTVWGNCSSKQNVSLNWQLIRAPRFVIDYVILHELLHTRFMSHSQIFWRNMSRLCGQYKDAIAWLHANRPNPA